MRMYPREFPSGRRKKPKRQAEKRVYEALAGSDRQGFCYYEWRKGYGRIELDFAVWIEGLGRFALQVKGGRYLLIDGEWYLKTLAGVQPVRSSPLDEAWLGALDLHDDIEELAETAYNPFVIPVLIFPGMERDEAIAKLARRKGVYLLWGPGDPVAGFEEVSWKRGVSDALSAERISREVYAVTDGLIRLDGARGDADAGETESRRTGSQPQGPNALSLSAGGLEIIRVSGRVERHRVRSVIDHPRP